jgi:hypothetical protein
MKRLLQSVAIAAAVTSACGGGPDEASLRESFARQLAANGFVKDFQRNGDELTFTAPGAEGGTAKWRVQIDSAVIEPNDAEAQPYKGTVKSSWYSDGQPVRPSGGESNLPFELLSTGLSQDCWAFWDSAAGRWAWE